MNKYLALCVGIVLLAVPSAGPVESSGTRNSSGQTAVAKLTVRVLDSTGATVTSVKPSEPLTFAINGYWITFTGAEWTLAEVRVYVLNSPGLTQNVIETRLSSSFYPADGVSLLPFTIGDWGGAVHGSVQIQIRTYNGATQTGYAVKSLNLL